MCHEFSFSIHVTLSVPHHFKKNKHEMLRNVISIKQAQEMQAVLQNYSC